MKNMLAAATAAIAILLSTMPLAHALEKPAGEVILSVTGAVTQTNNAGRSDFDLTMLEALARHQTTAATPWTEGKPTFDGPLLKAVLEAAGARGSRLVVKALNDYSAEVPLADANDLDTILATRIDGKELSVREKGPLFLIYPFDTNPELYNEKYFGRSVWQIREIEVVE
ncbi:MAG: molybdopterin-dependent oxidoreductase [Nitratireductor sp.]|nr:molybdopterin-dependent oxidoreductase [Nitratireductor sp.]